MQHSIKIWHVIRCSIKKCGSFMKCVVLVPKPWLLVTYSAMLCLHAAKFLVSPCRRNGENNF